jgi:pyruvate kinase
VIVATQMLESMVEASRPTRAEASDVANAIFDGADAVMLSAETATGKFPTEACAMMARIVAEAEAGEPPESHAAEATHSTSAAVAAAASRMAEELKARLVLVFSSTGNTARLVSQARPAPPCIGLSSSDETLGRMALYWGVQPHPFPRCRNVEELVHAALRFVRERSLAVTGDRVVLVFGTPLNERGTTNSIRVESV